MKQNKAAIKKNEIPQSEKHWHEKFQVIVPIIVALITGLFVILGKYLPETKKEEKSIEQKTKDYELVFIDHRTLKPAEFESLNTRIKIFVESTPLILPIDHSIVKFSTTKISPSETTFLDFDSFTKYRLVDRNQLLKEGKNKIFVAKDSINLTPIVITKGKQQIKNKKIRPKITNIISGRIIDQRRKAIQGVLVVTTDKNVITDSLGKFTISIPLSDYRIRLTATKVGYKDWDDYVATNKKNLEIQLKYAP